MDQAVAKKISAFFEPFPLMTFAKGELVLFADESVPPISHVLEGRVGQYDISGTGNKVMLTIYRPGAFFPMSCAVNDKPNRHFFEALEPVQVRQAPAAEVVAFVRREPEVLFNLLQRLYRGTDGLLGRMSLLMSGTAHSRLLYELSIAAERFGVRQPDGSFLIEVTKSQLASQTGLARETISRELQKCVKQGMVRLAKGRMFVTF